MTSKMRILILLNPARFWRWQKWVIDALCGDANYQVELRLSENTAPIPSGLRLLFTLERLLYGKVAAQACDLLSPATLALSSDKHHNHDLIIEFSATDTPMEADFLQPVFDGRKNEMAAVSALLSHQQPQIGVVGRSGYHPLGQSAAEQPLVLTHGLDQCFSRMADLLIKAVRAQLNGEALTPVVQISKRRDVGTGFSSGRFALSSLLAKINLRLKHLSHEAPRWAIGWRQIHGDATYDTLQVAPDDFARFPDDTRRFFADPFVFVHGGTTYVFCEEFPFATQKGIISVFTIDENGGVSAARSILERPYHLSYPFVFAHDGQIWMIPESSGNRTVELYRAVSFPDQWVLERVLLDDLLADDATLHIDDDKLWLFASTRAFNSSSWDTLGLFSAAGLMRNWSAHRANPVLCDMRTARPGGALFYHSGDLWRPSQDCAGGYGAGLTLSRITRLDDEGFAQADTRILRPDGRRDLSGMHTLNAAGGYEVIDMFGRF